MRHLAIYGTGGMAREVLGLVMALNAVKERFRVIGWLDDNAALVGSFVKGLPVLGPIESASEEFTDCDAVIAIGSPAQRYGIARRLQIRGVESPILVDPRAHVGPDVALGAGSIICAGSTITTDVHVGSHVIINVGVSVSHDALLSDFVTVAPGACLTGSVHIGEGADVGVGVVTIQGVTIGAWSTIGAGAAVVNDVPANATAVGVPARIIRERPVDWHMV